MSFLDQIKSQVQPAQIVSALISQEGGVQGVVRMLEQGGLGSLVQSWIGTGPNQPVSEPQIASVVGQERIAALAAKFGVSPQDLQSMLATFLPILIDKLSPNGQITEEPSILNKIVALGESALKNH